MLIQSIDSALSISELKLDYFNQFSEIVAIVASFRVGTCVESLYQFNAFFLQRWESFNWPNFFSLLLLLLFQPVNDLRSILAFLHASIYQHRPILIWEVMPIHFKSSSSSLSSHSDWHGISLQVPRPELKMSISLKLLLKSSVQM